MMMMTSGTSAGRPVRKRIAPPNSAPRSPTSGLRSRTLNGPLDAAALSGQQMIDHGLLLGRHLVVLERLEPVAHQNQAVGIGAGLACLEGVWALTIAMATIITAQKS